MNQNPLDELTARDILIVKAFANSDMRIYKTCKVVGMDKTTVRRRLSSICKKSKLDPRKFRELVILIHLIEGGSE